MGRIGNGVKFTKYALLVFNLLVMMISLPLIVLGAAVLLKSSALTDLLPMGGKEIESMPSSLPWTMIFAGLVMFLFCVLGCCGAFNDNYCALVMYAIILFVVIILQIILGVLVYFFGHIITDEVKSALNKHFSAACHRDDTKISANHSAYQPVPEEVYSQFFDEIRTSEYNFILTLQEKFSCCGINGTSDYSIYGINFSVLDKSCCPAEIVKCIPDIAYDGCLSKLLKHLVEWKPFIQGGAIGFVCLEVIAAASALYLAKGIRI